MVSTDFKDYYAILGVSKTTSEQEIKKKFRKLALQYHPDRNPGNQEAEARFKEISEAYEVLSDSEKRKKYDRFGQYWKQAGQNQWSGNNGVNVDFSGFDFNQYDNFEEFLKDLLGRSSTDTNSRNQSYRYRSSTNGRTNGYSGYSNYNNGYSSYSNGFRNQTAQTSNNLEAKIRLSFSEAFRGAQKRLHLGDEIINVRIPPGTKSGSRVRVRGKGQYSSYTQQKGDLYLQVELEPHSFFEFEGENLLCEVPIAPDEAVLGTSIEVPTPDGMVSMKVPPGIRSGQSLRLRGKGWPLPKGGRSDQLVKIIIATPKDISPVEREYYQKINANRSYNPRCELENVKL
ncbi:MAG: DnaJ C-terminal domain-containing protein [Prochloraceae cyanobacterium]|nr:DnaJ C-terminal domain-containing protein [Prochloraceae cyanobacterium]